MSTNDLAAPFATAYSREVTGIAPGIGDGALVALVRLLGREAARAFFLGPPKDDAAA